MSHKIMYTNKFLRQYHENTTQFLPGCDSGKFICRVQDPAGGEGVCGAGVRHTFTREMHWGEQERRDKHQYKTPRTHLQYINTER